VEATPAVTKAKTGCKDCYLAINEAWIGGLIISPIVFHDDDKEGGTLFGRPQWPLTVGQARSVWPNDRLLARGVQNGAVFSFAKAS
jgi:hypothetical protein